MGDPSSQECARAVLAGSALLTIESSRRLAPWALPDTAKNRPSSRLGAVALRGRHVTSVFPRWLPGQDA